MQCVFSKSPVIIVRAVMQENAGTSTRMLWRLEEKSVIESIHSPNARTHCSRCRMTPLQKMSLSSTRLDLDRKNVREKHKDWLLRRRRENRISVVYTQEQISPVRQAQDEKLQERGIKQQLLVALRELCEAGYLLRPATDDAHGAH